MPIFGPPSPWERKTGRLGSWPNIEPRETRSRSTPKEKLELRTDGFQQSFSSDMKILTKYVSPIQSVFHNLIPNETCFLKLIVELE